MNEPLKIALTSSALSSLDIYSPTAISTTRQIAGSTIIHSPDLETIDKVYSSIIIVERILWSSINYAHVILTPNGEYFLVLIEGPDMFNDHSALFIPLGSGEFENSYNNTISLFSQMFLDRVKSGQISCYPEDLGWL